VRILSGILVLALFILGCEKKQSDPKPANPVAPTTTSGSTGTPAPDPDCGNLPDPPPGFQWIDSTFDANKKISAFFYNPTNAQEIMVVVEGDQLGGNQLFSVNLVSKNIQLIAQLDNYLPSINNKGWILFSNVDKNIFKIKANGDSLTELVSTNAATDPKWDYTGKNFYYLQDEFSTIPAQLILANDKGQPQMNWPHHMPYTAPFHKSDKIIVMRNTGNVVTAYLRDFETPAEIPLFSGPFNGEVHFQFMCVDANDERLYWSNELGIFTYHFESKKTDTLFRNCETVSYARPMTGEANEIHYSKHKIRTSYPYWLVHSYSAMEYNVVLKEIREIKVF
jgi:hypothetical protein